MESSKRRRKRIETPRNYYANGGALAPIKQSPGYFNVVDLTKPNRKPPTATYVQKSQLFSPVEKATPLASVGRNAVTPSSGFLLTPSNTNYERKKIRNDAFLPKFSDRKVAIDTKETSRPASPDHSDTKLLEGGRIANEHCTNENKLKHALNSQKINSQPLISGFMEKSDIKWDGERPDVGKKKNKRSLLADAASGIFRGGTCSGRNVDSSFSASSSSSSPSNSSSPSYFNGFANRKK